MEKRVWLVSSLLVLSVLAALISIPGAHASVQLSYDNGPSSSAYTDFNGHSIGVRFSLQPGWTGAKLLTAVYYLMPSGGLFMFTVLVLASDHATPLTPSFSVTPSATGFFDVDLSSLNIVVTGDFYVGLQWQTDDIPSVGLDNVNPGTGRSYVGAPPAAWTQLDAPSFGYGNLIIRVDVDPITPPPIPEYPLGLPLLAIFMAVGYGLVRRRARKQISKPL